MPIGDMNLQKTQDVCEHRRSSHEATGHDLRWKREVNRLAAAVSAALRKIEAQESAADRLDANEDAVSALDECATRLADTEEHPGYDPSHLFTTHMGKNSSARLRDNCAKVRDNLAKLQPTLRWQIAVEEVESLQRENQQAMAAAGKETDAGDRADRLRDTIEGFEECARRAGELAALKGHAGASPSKSERRAIKGLVNACNKDVERVRALVAAAEGEANSERKSKRSPKKKRRKKKKR